MSTKLSLAAVGHASSIFLSMTFTLCVLFDVTFPQYAMYSSWQALLPGFDRISWSSFLIGLLESYGYGWYIALIWVPLYNVFAHKFGKECKHCCQNKESET